MIELVPEEDWDSLQGIYEHELNSVLPDKGKARLPAVIEDDQLLAFCTVEKTLRCDQWWVAPTVRNTPKAASLIRRLVTYLRREVPAGTSAVIIASTEHQENLIRKLGFKEVPGKLFSLNVE